MGSNFWPTLYIKYDILIDICCGDIYRYIRVVE